VETEPDRVGALDLVVETGAVGPQVVVIEGGRATRQCQLGQAQGGGDPDVVGGHAGPDRIERPQPSEQPGILCPRHYPGQGLIQVMMGVDQTRKHQMPGQVDDLVGLGRQVGGGTHRFDPAVAGEQSTVGDLGAVHGGEQGGVANQERGHEGHRTVVS
jgi:hypothetical protein